MTDELDYKELKEKADRIREKRDKASGQLESALEQLKTEFGCATPEEEVAKLKEALEAEARALKEYNKLAKKFDAKWGDMDEAGDDDEDY